MPEIGKNWEGQLVERRFLLRQYLGGTASSAVFLTERGPDREKAAIKLIPASLVDPAQQLARWEAASRLSHPNLLRLHETGTCQLGDTALLFVVMDYADETLSQILPERPLAPTEVLAMLPPVLEGLQFLHRHGFVHGRIQPSNILAAGDRLQLSSDGIVPVGERKNPPTKPGAYDAPETLQGGLTAAADVWSIGATVVEALTQKTPVVPDTEQGEPDVPPTLPAPFLMIARNCLRRDPARRSTITAITDRLPPAHATRPQPAPQPAAKAAAAKVPSTSAASAKAAPSKSYLLPVIVITLLLVAGVAGLRYLLRPSAAQPSVPSTASSEKPPVAAPAPLPSPKPSAATPSSPARPRRSAGVIAQGAVLNQVLPDVPASAVHTISGHFRVAVKVTADATGKVTDATLETAGPSQYFARKCVEAARSWTFTPPQVRDQSAASEWVIHFAFSHSGIEPSATQTAP